MRLQAIKDSENLPAAARLDPKKLRPPEHSSARAGAFLTRLQMLNPLPLEEQKREDFDRSVTWTRNTLSREYTEGVRRKFAHLRTVNWPIIAQKSNP